VFGPELDAALERSDRARDGRAPYDAVLMFKVLVLQALYTLSDDRTEYQIRDRLSFMRFVWLALEDRVPTAKTVWLFREQLTRAGAVERLFGRFDAALPPAHAVVLSVDEKSQIQALDRTQPGLPLKKGKAGRMTFDYKRNGITTLFAAFDVLDGTVIGQCMQRHRHQEFIRFLKAIERAVPAGKVNHVILDNCATHKNPKVLRRVSRQPFRVPLDADLMLLAERRRDGLLPAHPAPARTRRVPLDCRPSGRDQPLHRGSQRRAQAPRLDRHPLRHPHQVARGTQALASIH
jgi:IS5 family transposase